MLQKSHQSTLRNKLYYEQFINCFFFNIFEKLKMSRLVAGVLALLVLVSSSGPVAEAVAPPCGRVISQLSPCLPFLAGNEAEPSATCCKGVKYIAGYSEEKEDRRAICQCLESSASMFKGIDLSLIPSVPESCHVSVKLPPISLDFDCSKA